MAPKWVGEKGALGLACDFYYLRIGAMSISNQIFVQSAAMPQGLERTAFRAGAIRFARPVHCNAID